MCFKVYGKGLRHCLEEMFQNSGKIANHKIEFLAKGLRGPQRLLGRNSAEHLGREVCKYSVIEF